MAYRNGRCSMLQSSYLVRSQMILQLLSILLLLTRAAANFHEGDFIPSARRAQFGGVSHGLQAQYNTCLYYLNRWEIAALEVRDVVQP